LARNPLGEMRFGLRGGDRVGSIRGPGHYFDRIDRFGGGADERANLERARFSFFPKRGRAAEVNVAADDDGDGCDDNSTAVGAPALEPEAGDWNRDSDHSKKKQEKQQRRTPRLDSARLWPAPLSFEASGATTSTSRRGTEPMRILLEATLPRHGENRGLLAQVGLLFFIYAVSGRRRSRPRAGSPRRRRRSPPCAVLLARS
jgi:hypothetical protein